MTLALYVADLLRRAPEGWERSVVLSHDPVLGSVHVTLMDVNYHLEDDEAALERVQSKQVVSTSDLQLAVDPNDRLRFLLQGMERDITRKHER